MILTSTKNKLFLAWLLHLVLCRYRQFLRLPMVVEVRRNGVQWRLDLQEGIDLSIYVFGYFEPSTARALRNLAPEAGVVLDVGANIGAHALHLANAVGPKGKVFAFEPTNFGFQKLLKNISLNPVAASIIDARQIMLVEDDQDEVPDAIYSSWPIEFKRQEHEIHRGASKDTKGASALTLDRFVMEARIGRVDLIKLDVDGYDCSVLRGARKTLRNFAPTIVMELAPYGLEEHGSSIEELIDQVRIFGYVFYSEDGVRKLPQENRGILALIPSGGSINVRAVPMGSDQDHSSDNQNSLLDAK